MTRQPYIALIHKEPESGYGVSFPDVPGVITVADTLAGALVMGADVLDFAFEDWEGDVPAPRTLDALRLDPVFLEAAVDAVVAAIVPARAVQAAAE